MSTQSSDTPSSEPDVKLAYVETIDEDHIQPIVEELRASPFSVSVRALPPPGPWASAEWFIPTAVVLFLSKSYFDGFLKEAGKEHYQAVSRGLSRVWSTFFGPNRQIVVRVVASSPGKVVTAPKYSRSLSVMADSGQRARFKLLLNEDMSADDLRAATQQFTEFVLAFHQGTLELACVEQLERASRHGGLFLVAYDLQVRKIIVVDPLNHEIGKGQ